MKEQRRRRRFQSSDSKAAVDITPPHATPTPEIPVLKEKEDEKKGGGVPWYAGSGSGAPGLVGGQGIGRAGGALAARGGLFTRMAGVLANAFGGPTTFLGGLFAGAMGKWLVLGGLLAWGGLLVGAASRLSGGWGAAGAGIPGLPSLGSVSSAGIVIDAPKDRSLGYLSGANKGEILWDQGKPVQPETPKDAAAPEEAPPIEEPKPEPPAFEMPDVSALQGGGGLNRDGFVKKLTSDVSQLRAGGPGSGAPQIKNAGGFQLKKTFDPRGSQAGKLGGMSRAKRALSASRLSNLRGRSSRAAGQLKLAKAMSVAGQSATTIGDAKTYSADAFDQGKSIGGNLAGIDGDGIVMPSGGGAPGLESGVPDLPPGTPMSPYQSEMDTAKGMGDQAAALKTLGMMMLAIGASLVAMGLALMGNHTTFPIGYALLGAGLALIAMGMMMLGMSANMAKQAQDQGKKVDEQYGQKDQGAIVDDCANQATTQGVKADDCKAQKPPQVENPNPDLKEAIEAERNATYTLEGETSE
ncbi:MAG: hypothetical protein HY928_06580 [Elusimicrobia bacterium]|nr:hypothetical protein [Elusimicrobiota bacterium]